jgi:hypothetical protein
VDMESPQRLGPVGGSAIVVVILPGALVATARMW